MRYRSPNIQDKPTHGSFKRTTICAEFTLYWSGVNPGRSDFDAAYLQSSVRISLFIVKLSVCMGRLARIECRHWAGEALRPAVYLLTGCQSWYPGCEGFLANRSSGQTAEHQLAARVLSFRIRSAESAINKESSDSQGWWGAYLLPRPKAGRPNRAGRSREWIDQATDFWKMTKLSLELYCFESWLDWISYWYWAKGLKKLVLPPTI